MIEFGNALKTAREAKGLSIAQLADQTHMLTSVIDGLERENFTKIAAPIYGRGFVKLYCEAVGLESKPFVDEFMEIFNGNRDLTIRERPVPPPSANEPSSVSPVEAPKPLFEPTQPVSNEPVAAEPPPRSPQMGLFDPPEPPPVKMPLAETVTQPYADQPTDSKETTPDEEAPAFSRYATPLHSRYDKPEIAWSLILRWGIISMVCAVFLTLLVFGLKALYQATATPKSPRTIPVETLTPASVQNKPQPQKVTGSPATKTVRTPVQIPDLYVD